MLCEAMSSSRKTTSHGKSSSSSLAAAAAVKGKEEATPLHTDEEVIKLARTLAVQFLREKQDRNAHTAKVRPSFALHLFVDCALLYFVGTGTHVHGWACVLHRFFLPGTVRASKAHSSECPGVKSTQPSVFHKHPGLLTDVR